MDTLAPTAFDSEFGASNPTVKNAHLARRDDKPKQRTTYVGLSLVPTTRNKVFIDKDGVCD
jgi:hypothetical protein